MVVALREAYELREFTPERLEKVTAEWRDIAGDDEFQVELAAPLAWCAAHITPREGDGHALELYHNESDSTDAILEVVNSRGTMSKLLKLYVNPAFWESGQDPAREEKVLEVHAVAYAELIIAGIGKGMHCVKIYGRTDRMYRMLSRLREVWQADVLEWDAAMEGRWLTLKSRN